MLKAEDDSARSRSAKEHRGRTQARRCRALLSSIVLLAIDDACIPTDRGEVRVKRNLNALALSGLHFLFHPDSTFPQIAELLDLNVDVVRAELYRRAAARRADEKHLYLRARLRWMGNPQYIVLPPQDVIDKLSARWRSTHA